MLVDNEIPDRAGHAVLVVGWVATAAGWWLDRRKKLAELQKLQLEAVTEAGKSLEQLQRLRRGYEDTLPQATSAIAELIPLLRDHSDEDLQTLRSEISSARDRACSTLFESAFPRLREWAEYGCVLKRHEPEKLEFFLNDEIAEELENIPRWLAILNMRRFVDVLRLTPARFSGPTLSTFRSLALELPSNQRTNVANRLHDVTYRISQCGSNDGS